MASLPRFAPPSRRYGAYIFDCDGTLADTMPLHHLAWQAALERSGAPFDFHWERFMSRAGMSLEETVLQLSAEFAHPLDAVAISEQQRVVYAELENRVVGIPEVVKFARDVSAFAPIAVASGSVRRHVERTLESIGARNLFAVIVTPEDVARGKPFPDMFLLAAELMGVAAADCLVLEDAEFGFEAARRAGMEYVRVGPPEFLEEVSRAAPPVLKRK